jgi:hypothetical protein
MRLLAINSDINLYISLKRQPFPFEECLGHGFEVPTNLGIPYVETVYSFTSPSECGAKRLLRSE